MITNLQNLPEAFNENKIANLASWAIKYQNFRLKAALKFKPAGYTDNTLGQYQLLASKYFNRGYKEDNYRSFYKQLDLLSKRIQPLTPSEKDKKREIKRSTNRYLKDNPPPVAKLEILKKPLTAKIIYGIRFDDFIKIFESEEEANGFNKGMLFAGKEGGKVVTVELGEP